MTPFQFLAAGQKRILPREMYIKRTIHCVTATWLAATMVAASILILPSPAPAEPLKAGVETHVVASNRDSKLKRFGKAALKGAALGIFTGPLLGASVAEGAVAGAGRGAAFEAIKPGRLLKKLVGKRSGHKTTR